MPDPHAGDAHPDVGSRLTPPVPATGVPDVAPSVRRAEPHDDAARVPSAPEATEAASSAGAGGLPDTPEERTSALVARLAERLEVGSLSAHRLRRVSVASLYDV